MSTGITPLMMRSSVKSGGGKVVAALLKEHYDIDVASQIEDEDDAEMAVFKLYQSLDKKSFSLKKLCLDCRVNYEAVKSVSILRHSS
jgi:hypothetical protein